MKTKDRKLTDKYIIRIERITLRPASWDESHGMIWDHKTNEGDPIREFVFEGEYEIKDRKVIDLLAALLK